MGHAHHCMGMCINAKEWRVIKEVVLQQVRQSLESSADIGHVIQAWSKLMGLVIGYMKVGFMHEVSVMHTLNSEEVHSTAHHI